MEFTVSKPELMRELTVALNAVEAKTTIPILSNMLLEATAEGEIQITSTDLEISIRTSCTARVAEPGACTLPARKLYDYVKLLPESEVKFKSLENHWVAVSCGRSRTKSVGMSKDNFPQLPQFPEDNIYEMSRTVLRGLIARTSFAITNEPSRFSINGALLILTPNSVAMVATDGHRMAHCENELEIPAGVTEKVLTVIPKKALIALSALLDSTDNDVITLCKDERMLFFQVGGRLLTSVQLAANFPSYDRVLPKNNNKTVVLNTLDLNSSVLRCAQYADERTRAVRMSLVNKELKFTARSTSSGDSEDSIPVEYVGEPMEIGFNAEYIVDFLKAVGTSEIRLDLKDSLSAAQMRPAEGDDYNYRYILMPTRL